MALAGQCISFAPAFDYGEGALKFKKSNWPFNSAPPLGSRFYTETLNPDAIKCRLSLYPSTLASIWEQLNLVAKIGYEDKLKPHKTNWPRKLAPLCTRICAEDAGFS